MNNPSTSTPGELDIGDEVRDLLRKELFVPATVEPVSLAAYRAATVSAK